MKFELGKTFSLTPATPPQPGKAMVDEIVLGVEGNVLKLRIPAVDRAITRNLLALRAYVVPHDQTPPTTADGYAFPREDEPVFPYAEVDLSDPAWADGGDLNITLPDGLDPLGFGQLVHGYED